jgi:hypothetical protein
MVEFSGLCHAGGLDASSTLSTIIVPSRSVSASRRFHEIALASKLIRALVEMRSARDMIERDIGFVSPK